MIQPAAVWELCMAVITLPRNVWKSKLDKIHHISEKEFKFINWLPSSKRVYQYINTITYNFVNNIYPSYLNEIFKFAPHCRIGTRNNFSKLKNPFCKTNMGQKTNSYIDPSVWNSLPDSIEEANTLLSNIMSKSITWLE